MQHMKHTHFPIEKHILYISDKFLTNYNIQFFNELILFLLSSIWQEYIKETQTYNISMSLKINSVRQCILTHLVLFHGLER